MTAAALLTSTWSHWTSPDVVLHRVRCLAPIDLDPCGNANDEVRAAESWRGLQHPGPHGIDGLTSRWLRPGRGLIYANPMFGRKLPDWTAKAVEEGRGGCEIVMLLPARTDTKWWHDHVVGQAQARCFWRGRLKFGNPPPAERSTTSTFPSCIVYWGHRPYAFGAAFEDAGEVVIG